MVVLYKRTGVRFPDGGPFGFGCKILGLGARKG